GLVAISFSLVPLAVIAKARGRLSPNPRIHFVQDMDNQHRVRAQQASPSINGNPLFRDGRGMRPAVDGTISREAVILDDHYTKGLAGDARADSFPRRISVDMALLERGQERFNIYCFPCHGRGGFGDGPVHKRATNLMKTPTMSNGTSWVAPKSVHEEQIRMQPVGQLFNTVTNGVRTMAGYGDQVGIDDRWAIVAYVRALQRSQYAREGDVEDAASLPVDTIEADAAAGGDQ
ncbi:MAG: c-type cytochrome, partial [Planctomycetota bacterium]